MQGTHPVLACAADLTRSLKDVADVNVAFMPTEHKRDALLRLEAVASQLDGLRMRLIAASADVADDDGQRDVAAWLAQHLRLDRPVARRSQRLASSLDESWPLLAQALSEGAVHTAQADVIAHALDDLPPDLPVEVLARAEAQLISDAAIFKPDELRLLGRRILEVVAPEIGEEHVRRLLEAEDAAGRRGATLHSRRNGDGTTSLRITIPHAPADRLMTYLHAYTSPRLGAGRATAGSLPVDGERTPYAVRLGHALCALLEHVDPRRLPLHGGDATQVLVTIDLQSLRDGLGVAVTDAGHPITASEARRLACTAGVIPAVLAGRSEVLDLGRSSRLFSAAQRKALRLRDTTCRTIGCDIPAAWCEAHHATQPWAAGGRTDLADGQLLCSYHHHRAHDPGFTTTHLPDGDVRFHRRT